MDATNDTVAESAEKYAIKTVEDIKSQKYTCPHCGEDITECLLAFYKDICRARAMKMWHCDTPEKIAARKDIWRVTVAKAWADRRARKARGEKITYPKTDAMREREKKLQAGGQRYRDEMAAKGRAEVRKHYRGIARAKMLAFARKAFETQLLPLIKTGNGEALVLFKRPTERYERFNTVDEFLERMNTRCYCSGRQNTKQIYMLPIMTTEDGIKVTGLYKRFNQCRQNSIIAYIAGLDLEGVYPVLPDDFDEGQGQTAPVEPDCTSPVSVDSSK